MYLGKVRLGNDTVTRPYIVGPHNGMYCAMPVIEFLHAEMFLAFAPALHEALRAAAMKLIKSKIGQVVGGENPYVVLVDPVNIGGLPRHSACDANTFFESHVPFAAASTSCSRLNHFPIKKAETELQGYEVGLSSYWYAVKI